MSNRPPGGLAQIEDEPFWREPIVPTPTPGPLLPMPEPLPTPLITTADGRAVPASGTPPGQHPALDRIIDASRIDRGRIVVLREGVPVEILPVEEGRVTVEAERTPRRTLEATVYGDPWWVPTKRYHALDARSDIELRAENGIVDPATGEEYWWSMGIFMVRTAKVTNQRGRIKIEISAPDRSGARRWPLEGGVAFASGTSVEQAVTELLRVGRTKIDVATVPTGYYLPVTVLGKLGDDPWMIARDLAASVGYDLAYDVYGTARLTQIVDPAKVTPSFTWSDETTASSLVTLTRDLDGADMVDGIILQWSGGVIYHPAPPLVTTPAMWEGDASLILTAEQAQRAAEADLLRREGLVETINFTRWADPRREVGEVVRVVDPATGVDFAARITGLAYGLARETMEVRVANRRINQ